MSRPPIVCLCGSSRFGQAFQEANLRETLAGKIVLSIATDGRGDDQLFAGLTPAERVTLDERLAELHCHKIAMADEVLILNQGGYIGDATRREIAFAESLGKPVRYLEPA